MKKSTWVLAIIIMIATILPATGQVKWSVGPELTSTGFGLGFTAKITPRLGVSLEASTVGSLANQAFETYGDEAVPFDSDVDITLDIQFRSLLLVGSFYPFGRKFSIDAGMFWGGYAVEATVTPNEGIEFGNTIYTPAEVGTVTLNSQVGGPSPILMVGWRGRGLNLSVGAFYNNVSTDLSVSGLIANDPTFEEDLQSELTTLEDEAAVYPFFPYFRLGFQFGPK